MVELKEGMAMVSMPEDKRPARARGTVGTVPFVLTPVPPAPPAVMKVEARLIAFLGNLRRRKFNVADPDEGSFAGDDSEDEGIGFATGSSADTSDVPERRKPGGGSSKPWELSLSDIERIERRARAYVARVTEVRRQHLQIKDHLQNVEGVRRMPVVAPPSLDRADEIAALMHTGLPWFRSATVELWNCLRLAALRGDTVLRLPPMLLVGSGGIGKTWWAGEVARLLGLPFLRLDAATEPAAWSVIGLQRGWSSGEAGKVLTHMLRSRTASPLIFVDEIEKAGSPGSNRGMNYALTDALLPLLEPSTSKTCACPFYR